MNKIGKETIFFIVFVMKQNVKNILFKQREMKKQYEQPLNYHVGPLIMVPTSFARPLNRH